MEKTKYDVMFDDLTNKIQSMIDQELDRIKAVEQLRTTEEVVENERSLSD